MTAGFVRRSQSVATELNKVRGRRPPSGNGRIARAILTKPPSGCACAPVSLPRTVFGIFTQLLTVELVRSQPAESNRNRTSPCAEQFQRIAETAAGLIQISVTSLVLSPLSRNIRLWFRQIPQGWHLSCLPMSVSNWPVAWWRGWWPPYPSTKQWLKEFGGSRMSPRVGLTV